MVKKRILRALAKPMRGERGPEVMVPVSATMNISAVDAEGVRRALDSSEFKAKAKP
jgi:hypothetical protein